MFLIAGWLFVVRSVLSSPPSFICEVASARGMGRSNWIRSVCIEAAPVHPLTGILWTVSMWSTSGHVRWWWMWLNLSPLWLVRKQKGQMCGDVCWRESRMRLIETAPLSSVWSCWCGRCTLLGSWFGSRLAHTHCCAWLLARLGCKIRSFFCAWLALGYKFKYPIGDVCVPLPTM